MIDYNIEFTKGILFVRLIGILNKKNESNIENDIYEIIKDGGIRHLVFNLEDLEVEDEVNLFINCENIIKSNNGKMIICGSYNGNYINNFNYVDDELCAIRELSIC